MQLTQASIVKKAKEGLAGAIKQKDIDYALEWIDWTFKEAYKLGRGDWSKDKNDNT